MIKLVSSSIKFFLLNMHGGLLLRALCIFLEMPHSMPVQIAFLREAQVAYVTREGPYAIVNALVDGQMRLPHESLSTHVALILAILHRQMRINVRDQVLLVTVNAIENIARVQKFIPYKRIKKKKRKVT